MMQGNLFIKGIFNREDKEYDDDFNEGRANWYQEVRRNIQLKEQLNGKSYCKGFESWRIRRL